MSRHPIDHSTPPTGARTRAFAEIARQSGDEGSHPASRQIARRAHIRPAHARSEGDSRVPPFARIDRGQQA